ncbi:MAG TPA: hypothetical protein VMZ26_05240 [Pyrinomonadaceae bacterium]|nr:hypothetical protein [Pyrinomonadaceae bacterium]
MTETGLALLFDPGNGVFPFNKINKQIENGPEDSVSSFYNSISVIFANQE